MTSATHYLSRWVRKVRTEPAVRASAWSVGGLATSQFLRLVNNLILTRLLVPDAFGLMALIMILLQGLNLLSDVGIQANIIRSSRGESKEFLDTAWTIQAVRGVILYVCVCLLTYPFASFYENDQLVAIIPVVGLTVLFSGFRSTSLILANRKLWVGRDVTLNLVTQSIGISVMIVWAWHAPSVWAIAAGIVVDALLNAILSHFVYTRWKNRFHWDRAAAAEIIAFGKWMFLSSALMFFAGQLDRLVLGKLVSLDVLGVYSIGFMWSQLALMVVMRWVSYVFFPLAADSVRDAADDGSRIRTIRRRLNIACGIAVALFFAISTPFFRLLYEPEYWVAPEVIKVCLVGVWFRVLAVSNERLNMVHGYPAYVSLASFAAIVFFAVSVFPMYQSWGALGVAGAYASGQFGAYMASTIGTIHARRSDFRVDLATCAGVLILTWVLYAAVSAVFG